MKLCECGCGKPAPVATQNRYERGQRRGDVLRFVKGHNPRQHGSQHARWRGDEASPAGIHAWLKRHYPKTGVCSECGERKERTEWAFLHHPGKHTREISDYRELCRRCHYHFDPQCQLMPPWRRSGSTR